MQNAEFRMQKARARLSCAVLLAVALWAIVPRGSADAQVRPIYDSGAAGLAHLLGRLQTTASVLHTGAHPDDEDSAFVARTARGDHARVAYLSLTRGEGGQNIIGPELFDALGVIRTEELLQARRLDGGEQFFTRAFDYGFSKTLAEARSKWNEREVLGDMVRVIRLFRPLVIHSRFAGTAADGHGQHQFAGYLTPHGVQGGCRSRAVSGADRPGASALAGAEAVSRGGPGRRGQSRHRPGADRRPRSRHRAFVRGHRGRGQEPAQVAGDGGHRAARPIFVRTATGRKPGQLSPRRKHPSSTGSMSAFPAWRRSWDFPPARSRLN